MGLIVRHRVDHDNLGLGIAAAHGVSAGPAPQRLDAALSALVGERRAQPLTPAEEAMRRASRDLLRNGSYKPTGRGKPASEYLLRAALEGTFPRVNGPVDANNFVSLAYGVAISLWDLDRAGTSELEFRLGVPGERYVFNPAGQVLELGDLVCGCGLTGGRSVPMVTPVKDSLATKIQADTTRVAGCIYFPLSEGGAERLAAITAEFRDWLAACGTPSRAVSGVCLPGATLEL